MATSLWSAPVVRDNLRSRLGFADNGRFFATVVDLPTREGDDQTRGCVLITTGGAMSNSWPEPDELTALFQQVCNGDKLILTDFLAAVLDPLVNHLRGWRPHADEHTHITAAEDAVLALLHNPTIYDPAQRGLIGFLCMSAQGDLLNALQKESRHHRNRESGDCVELAPDDGNSVADELADGLPTLDDPIIAAEIAGFNPTERAVFALMRGGERSTAAHVPLLGIEHLPDADQRREVKRVKERIMKRLRRAGGQS